MTALNAPHRPGLSGPGAPAVARLTGPEPRRGMRRLLPLLLQPLLLLPCLPPVGGQSVPTRTAALVQLRGEVLAGGSVQGEVRLPLERASGGDTPVLNLMVMTDSSGSERQTVRLLLDTGASSTMVTPSLVRRLALRAVPLDAADFAVAAGGEGCDQLAPARTLLPPLALGPAASSRGDHTARLLLRGVEALVLPVAALPPGVDGVLGSPTLRRLPIAIDPVAGWLALGAAALRQPAGAPVREARRIPLLWRRGVPLVELSTPMGPVAALADSGAEGLFLQPSLAARLKPLERAQEVRLVGVCGEQRVTRRRFAGLALPGELRDRPLEGIVTANPIFGQLGVEAIAGQEWLRHHRQLWRLDQDPPSLLLW